MSILIVSSAPKSRCGIANYATQQRDFLRQAGNVVHYASIDGGTEDVEYAFDLRGYKDWARLMVVAGKYDRVIVHYQFDLYHRTRSPNEIAAKNFLMAGLFARHRGVEILVHELEYAFLSRGTLGRKIWMSERFKWSLAPKIIFHTPRERTRFLDHFPGAEARVELKEHHSQMMKRRDCTQAVARTELDIPQTAKVFLCIGFVQESKGFDRVVQAFRSVESKDARLYIVGSVRVDGPGHRRYVDSLRRLVAEDPRVKLVERFTDDVEFDTWLIAADVVALPYRHIFSSSVAARARLFGKRILASQVGGLGDQLREGDVIFETEAELRDAVARMASNKPVGIRARRRTGEGLRIAFVPPWYGADVPGGAEAATRKTVVRLADAGTHVEVLTTCIKDYFGDWSVNARRAGVDRIDGVVVRRFPVQPRDAAAFSHANTKVVTRQPLTPSERSAFEGEMVKSPALMKYIATHRDKYDFFVFIPYMFSTTVQGAAACPGQAVHIPCLHDEGYLDLDTYAKMFKSARGIFFNSSAERDLGVKRFGLSDDQVVLAGLGVETDWVGDGYGFRAKHNLGDYIAFVGRREDKNFPQLVQNFRRYRDERGPDLSLVVMGPGGMGLRPTDGRSIVDLGFASEQDKRDALAGSLALCQPSTLESFSFTIMESWVAGRPVLVHSDCDVTREHAIAAGGGLYFKTYPEFAACLDRLRKDRPLADQLGQSGRHYVQSQFGWPKVVDTYLAAFERWKQSAATDAVPDRTSA